MKPTFYAKPYTPTIPEPPTPLDMPMRPQREVDEAKEAREASAKTQAEKVVTEAPSGKATPEPPLAIPLSSQAPQARPAAPKPPAPKPVEPKRPEPQPQAEAEPEVEAQPLKLPRVPTPKPRRQPRLKRQPKKAREPKTKTPDTLGLRRIAIVGRLVAAVITLAMVGVIARVYQLQTEPAPQLASLINAKYTSQELLGRRAPLLDREGRILATTGIAHRL